jgi:hypothetical protein
MESLLRLDLNCKEKSYLIFFVFQMGSHAELIAKKNGVYAELMRIQQSGINIL